jgi:hypothetical protein
MKHAISFLLLTLLSLQISACSSAPAAGASTPKTPQALQPTAVSTALFQVIKSDGTSVGVTIADLKTLALAQVSVEDKVEEDPKLLDVLALTGVTDFTEVTLTGSSNPATLTREQVDDNTILDFTNHGTVKLATTYVPKPNWTKDISTIEVKE